MFAQNASNESTKDAQTEVAYYLGSPHTFYKQWIALYSIRSVKCLFPTPNFVSGGLLTYY